MTSIAEALAERAELNRRADFLSDRMAASAQYQEGTSAAEDPMELLAEVQDLRDQIEVLSVQINKANNVATLADGTSVMEAIAHRDTIQQKIKTLKNLVTSSQDRRAGFYSTGDIRWVTDVDIKARNEEIDSLSRERRKLDVAIQKANWAHQV